MRNYGVYKPLLMKNYKPQLMKNTGVYKQLLMKKI